MPAPPNSPDQSVFDNRLLELLACPICFGRLRLPTSGEGIECSACLRRYPVIAGIPVLIPERALR